jgi:PIN domain nuclease of toxin-antitoxin system
VRFLVDTHSLIWTMDDPQRLSLMAAATIPDPVHQPLLSAATIWELSIKVGQGRISLSFPYRQWMDRAIADLKLTILLVTVEYADRQSTMPPHHKDPFDRLMIAQALVEGIPIVSADPALDPYGVTRIW